MPKLRKADVEDIDAAELDEAEYSTEEYTSYEGEVPPVGLVLRGYVKRMWWTRTQVKPDGSGDDPMLKVLWVAAENEGDLEQYNDCPFWLNLALLKSVKFRWGPFFEQYGLTMHEVTTKTYVESLTDTSDPNGAKIQRIGTFKPGENEDEAWCSIVTGREFYNGDWQARVKEWLPYDAAEDASPDGDEPEDADDEADEYDEADDAEEYDEDDEGDEDEGDEDYEGDEEPEPPRRGRKPAAAPARARASRTASKAPAARTGSRSRPAAAKPAAASRTGSRTRAAAKPAAASTKPARGGSRRGSRAAQDEPPF